MFAAVRRPLGPWWRERPQPPPQFFAGLLALGLPVGVMLWALAIVGLLLIVGARWK